MHQKKPEEEGQKKKKKLTFFEHDRTTVGTTMEYFWLSESNDSFTKIIGILEVGKSL